MTLNHATLTTLVLLGSLCARSSAAETFLVKDGRPRAEIVIAEQPPRTTRLAAHELQRYVEKISGAKLPVVRKPTGEFPLTVYVGESSHTDKLQVSADGLKHGAYRIVSGDDWLVLFGDDTDFTPVEPWPRNHGDWVSGRVHAEWEKITGAKWGVPLSQLRKHYTGRAVAFGTPNERAVDENGEVNVWGFDERGSYNAVCGFLRRLGVRWYMPGELGEVVPARDSIPLPAIDETVRPDFPVRSFNVRFGVHGREIAKWAMRLGVRDPYGLQIAHGMRTLTQREAILKAHPEWFALYGGKRQNDPDLRHNHLCYSNEELFQETVRYVRALFDHYEFDAVSVMPPDGYVAICQCSLCEGKDTPERDYRGRLSDYVWDFVNRVAREVKKTHPDKRISNCAYGVYTLPPEKIDKLEPNVLVCIVGGRRPTSSRREELRRLREDWVAKTDNPIMIFENYPFTDRGWYLPSYVPHVIGESINATKGISQGEDIWLSVNSGFEEDAVGFNHFLVYFTARMYWGGRERNVDALFGEYCRRFYGPAASEMQAFFEYCEANWREMEKDEAKANRALELFAAAKAAADESSIYGRRIALIGEYLNGLRNKREQLAQKRGPVPRLRLVGSEPRTEIVIDGKFDEQVWQDCPVASTGRLRELQTGRQPTFGTSFKTAWRNGNLYFAIRCEERDGKPLSVTATRDDDQAIWYGDVVEILLDTESHTYYQIAVSPSGAVADLDRGASKSNWFRWDSQAEVATHAADDHWTIEIRIPVVQDKNDPLHQVVGRKPTQSLPWHLNICRQRIRENGSEYSAFAPTGTASFHKVTKFAHFYKGRSHRFDVDPTVTDYLIESDAAEKLLRRGRVEEALEAYVALADGGDVTDYQASAALKQAARCARQLQNYDRATELAERIPLEPVARTVRMQNLLAMRKPQELVEQFGDEDIAAWPFWQAGEAWFARGRAFYEIGNGKAAEEDLTRAVELTPDALDRARVRLTLARDREYNLQDADGALATYRQIVAMPRHHGNSTYFRGLQGAARILRERGQYDEALAVLRKVEIDELRGYWHGSLLLAVGKTLAADDETEKALAAYKDVLADETTHPNHRKKATEAIERLTGR